MTEAEKECVRDRETRDQRTTNQTSEWNHHLFITNCSYNSRKRVLLEEQKPNYSYTEHYTLNTSSEVKVTVHQNIEHFQANLDYFGVGCRVLEMSAIEMSSLLSNTGTRCHPASVAPKYFSKSSTSMSLSRNHDRVPQDYPRSLL